VLDGGQGLWLIDCVLGATVAEAAVLAAFRAATGRGVALRELAAFLGAGLALLTAVRAAMAGASIAVLAGPLLAALVLHVWLLAQRWHR